MRNIEIKVLNPEVITESKKMMVCAARLTQRGHQIKNMNDFLNLYNKEFTDGTALAMTQLPHPTIQKFGVINIAIVGASRRFLAQITRHQNEVKFMSASLQYSDYSGEADFVIPDELYAEDKKEELTKYLDECKRSMVSYQELVNKGIDNDTCGYMAPQGLRNILIISATPYQLKHMISQRTCKRNTRETQYVMLKIWEALYNIDPLFFAPKTCGAPCIKNGRCPEGKMSCGSMMMLDTDPITVLKRNFPLLEGESTNEN